MWKQRSALQKNAALVFSNVKTVLFKSGCDKGYVSPRIDGDPRHVLIDEKLQLTRHNSIPFSMKDRHDNRLQ
jgi:hypothetical protein